MAGAWIQANTKYDYMLLDDQLARDELSKRIGLHQSLPKECKICKRTTELFNDHGVTCGYKQGGNRMAGTIVEKAIGTALKRLEDFVEPFPRLESLLGFMRLNTERPAKTFGDFLTFHKGRQVVIDVTLTSKLMDHKDLAYAERRKRDEYKNNGGFIEGGFVAMAVDCMGGWGNEMMTYFQEANDVYNQKSGSEQNRQMRYIREIISLAICKANGVYMRRIRDGIAKIVEQDKEEQAHEGQTQRRDTSEEDNTSRSNARSSSRIKTSQTSSNSEQGVGKTNYSLVDSFLRLTLNAS
jgi:hypothetical protein